MSLFNKLGIKVGTDANVGTYQVNEGSDTIHIQRVFHHAPDIKGNHENSSTSDTTFHTNNHYLLIETDIPILQYTLLPRVTDDSQKEGMIIVIGYNSDNKPITYGKWYVTEGNSLIAQSYNSYDYDSNNYSVIEETPSDMGGNGYLRFPSKFEGQHPIGATKLKIYGSMFSDIAIRVTVFPGTITNDEIKQFQG